MRRSTWVALVALETWFLVRYAVAGAQFHYWLHLLLGGALGLGLLTLARLLGRGRRWRSHEAGLVGHLWSAVPDVLFVSAGVLHVRWMDVFAAHITAHFLWPGPLAAGLLLWSLAVAATAAERLGHPRLAAAGLLALVALLGVAVVLRAPLPTTLQQVVEQGSNGRLPSAWVCRV